MLHRPDGRQVSCSSVVRVTVERIFLHRWPAGSIGLICHQSAFAKGDRQVQFDDHELVEQSLMLFHQPDEFCIWSHCSSSDVVSDLCHPVFTVFSGRGMTGEVLLPIAGLSREM